MRQFLAGEATPNKYTTIMELGQTTIRGKPATVRLVVDRAGYAFAYDVGQGFVRAPPTAVLIERFALQVPAVDAALQAAGARGNLPVESPLYGMPVPITMAS